MRTEDMPWWLQGIDIVGFEEEDDDSEEDDDEEESEEEDDDEESDDEDEDEDDEGEDDDDEEEKPNVTGLKSALRKERMARKKAERELKKLRAKSTKPKPKPKNKAKDEDDEDEDKSSAELEAERKKGEKLAIRLRDQAIDALIRKHATKFADPDDAVKLIDRSDIEFDQDEDDPSEIEIDEESIQDAVKALAKKKKHLLQSESGKGGKSGSKFNSKKKGKKEPTDEALRQKYAALRR